MNATKASKIIPIVIASIESLIQIPHFSQKLSKCHHHFYFTNKYPETLWNHQQAIKSLAHFKNVQVIENYQSAINQIQKSKEKLILIIGDPHHHLHQNIKSRKFITLEELCAVFPEKVPLSYRNHHTDKIKTKLEKRLGLSLDSEPIIEHVLITSHEIKMWDQAIQVLLDLNAKNIIVEYEAKKYHDEFQTLSLQDFIFAYKTCSELILPTISNAATVSKAPQIINFNEESRHIKWIIQNYGLKRDDQTREEGMNMIDGQLLEKSELQNFKIVKLDEIIF